MINIKKIKKLFYFFNSKIDKIKINKILLGGENDLSGYQYALMTGDFKRPSTLVKDGPHYKLLKKYLEIGYSVLDKENFIHSDYYKNAQQCIDLFGEYFPEIDQDDKIVLAAERFLRLYTKDDVSHLPSKGHSKDGELIEVIPIINSDCFQLVQGNHRVAFALARGDEEITAKILINKKETTPVQFLLKSLIWERGEKIIYQPLDCPELNTKWVLARKCTDRFDKMVNFLNSIRIDKNSSLLDLGCYYGWFVSKFINLGYLAEGVEKDNIPILIGKIIYKNLDNLIHKNDIIRFLKSTNRSYDIVCCLSIMHHFIYGREKGEALELLRLLDLKTNKVLFFEMGQEHEEWFKKLLIQWNTDKIESWVIENTSFKKCFHLGIDCDSTGKFHGNFGRMLFAFVK